MTNQFDGKLFESDVYKSSIYDSWLKNSTERDLMEQVFRDTFDMWCISKPLAIHDIGCGSGASAKRLFKILNERKVDFTYHGIDPYSDQLDRFRGWVGDSAKIELRTGTIQDYKSLDKEFDLGLAIHSLYYAADLHAALLKITRSSKRAIIVHHGRYGINEVHECFNAYMNPARANIISTFDDVETALKELSIPYELRRFATRFNIVPIKELNADGKNMIRFFLEKSKLPQEILEEVSCYFRKMSGEWMIHNVGYVFL